MTAIAFWGVFHRSAGRAVALVAAAGLACLPAQADFVPGRLYISGVHHQGPSPAHPDIIYEFDPATGESHLWTNIQPPFDRGTFALTFTPDGSRLLSASHLRNRVTAWDGSAQPHEFLGLADNVRGPTELAYDPFGNLYIASAAQGAIVRVPASGGPAEHFYGPLDGVGSMACLPNGDLFYATAGQRTILRFSPEGELQPFATIGFVADLKTTSTGDLIALASDGFHVFDGANANEDRMIPLGEVIVGPGSNVALSADSVTLFTRTDSHVWSTNIVNGATHLAGTIPGLRDPYVTTSMALYVPESSNILVLAAIGMLRLAMSRRRSVPVVRIRHR